MHKLGFVVVILYLRVFYHHKSIVWFFFPLPSQQSHKLIILPTHSCSRPRQMPLESGTDNLSCAEAACPGLSEASHSGQEVLSLGAHCSITPSDTSSQPHKKTDVHFTPTVLQPGPLPGVQTCVRSQPKLGTSAPISESANLERGNWGKGEGILKGSKHWIKHYRGVCGHLIFAVVLFVFSPLFAVGVCIADIYSGECCNVNGKEMDDL